MSGVGKMAYLKKTSKSHKGEVLEVCLHEVYEDKWNNETRYFFVNSMTYVPSSHLCRDFITTEHVVRWELATQSDIDEFLII